MHTVKNLVFGNGENVDDMLKIVFLKADGERISLPAEPK